MKIINHPSELTHHLGSLLATSPWRLIEQSRIHRFAEATDDNQWIHLDEERAAEESPYGGTIAHGLLTLSMLPALASEAYSISGFASRVNYGLNSVRFLNAVPSGSRIRGHFYPLEVIDKPNGRFLIKTRVNIEVEGSATPACVAETLALLIP